MTYKQAQEEQAKGNDVILTIRPSTGERDSVTLKASDYPLPCEFMLEVNRLIDGVKPGDFVFSAV